MILNLIVGVIAFVLLLLPLRSPAQAGAVLMTTNAWLQLALYSSS